MCQQGTHTIADQIIRRIMPGGDQQEGHRHQFARRDLVRPGLDQSTDQVVGRLPALALDQGKQILVKSLERLISLLKRAGVVEGVGKLPGPAMQCWPVLAR